MFVSLRVCVYVSTAGYGKMTFASDDKYIGYWKDGTRHGKVITIIRAYFLGQVKLIDFLES